MTLSSYFRRTQSGQRKRRAKCEQNTRRLRFETFEDRRMLSFTPGGTFNDGWNVGGDVVLADFDNDGHLDLASPNYYDDGTVSVLLGNGQGTFGDSKLFDVGHLPLSVAVGDFNEDGKLDLAAANQGFYDPPSIGVLLGNGDGTFGPVKPLPTGWGARSVAVGDFNADGHLDLGVSSSDGSYYSYASVRLGDGEGNFTAPIASTTIDGIYESVTAADLNGDGADDLLLTRNSKGGGGVLTYLGGHSSPYLQSSHVLNYSSDVRDVAVGDLNGDGVADLVTSSWGQDIGVFVLLGDGDGGYAERQRLSQFGGASVVLGDFTGDGHIDIAFGGLGILRGDGEGAFSVPERLAVGDASAAGDLNGDGWLDVISSNYGPFSVLLNDSNWLQLPGDYNGSGTVDAADYTAWRNSMGQSGLAPYSGSDGSGDGSVGPEDYDLWKSRFGQTLPLTTVSVRDVYVTEGNAGTTNAVFTVAISNSIDEDLTVHYATEDIDVGPDYAVAGSDYVAATGDMVIPAGETSATFTVAILGDLQDEADYEYLQVRLSVPTIASIWDDIGTGVIVNDDVGELNSVRSSDGGKGTALFTSMTTLFFAKAQSTMSYRNFDGWAEKSDKDYVDYAKTRDFAPGTTTNTVMVERNSDNKKEAHETFFVDLFNNPVDSSFSKFRGVGNNLNDD